MKLFAKKEKIILRSEQQRDDFIEKLESAHIDYDIREENDSFSNDHTAYVIRIYASDLKKVV